MKTLCSVLVFSATTFGITAHAMTDAELRAIVEQRYLGDRTGVCLAVAVVAESTASAYVCADPKTARPIGAHIAFEIGSVTKTMNAALLAELIGRGAVTLQDPLLKLLPKGSKLADFSGQPITLQHVVTHTSGLPGMPAKFRSNDPANPYAALTEKQLLDALAAAPLARAPGSVWEYSNFATMLLSAGLSRQAGQSFDTLISTRVFHPLAMDESYVAHPPEGVRAAAGHMSNGLPTHAWDLPGDLAGAGGVRSTLPDMIKYAEAQLGLRKSSLDAAIALTQQEIPELPSHRMGMNWMISPINGSTVYWHEGGTGGFSALVAFDPAHKRGVVVLADTSLLAVGGLGLIGFHLLDASIPIDKVRKTVSAAPMLIDALVGKYRFESGLNAVLRRKGDALAIQADQQPEFELAYDSAGDFYALSLDATLHPQRAADGRYVLQWSQMGETQLVKRVDLTNKTALPALNAEQLQEYVGQYPLTADFGLKVFVDKGKLFVQGTGQGAIEVAALGADTFVAEKVAAEIVFERDDRGKIVALVLKQGGHDTRGSKH